MIAEEFSLEIYGTINPLNGSSTLAAVCGTISYVISQSFGCTAQNIF